MEAGSLWKPLDSDFSLEEDESDLHSSPGVALYVQNLKTPYSSGTIQVTTHRLLYLGVPNNLQLLLSHIKQLDTSVIKVWSVKESPKIGISCRTGSYYRLSFRQGGRDDILRILHGALTRRLWVKSITKAENTVTASPVVPENQSSPSTQSGLPSTILKSNEFSTQHAGVGGILRQKAEKVQNHDQALQVAFQDIDALMRQAKEMVDLSQHLTRLTTDQDDDLRQFMIRMGISNPVTKESSGDQYHSQLAKEVSDFVCQVLPSYPGNVLPLAQVYCLYNRARGTALISPEDLYRACLLMESLRLPVRMKEFASGVRALHSKEYSDEEFCLRVEELLEEGKPLTASGVASLLGISITLAKEQLLMAEYRQILCRDDSVQGLIFYPNFFKCWTPSTTAH